MPSLVRPRPTLPLLVLGFAILVGAAALSFDDGSRLEAQSVGPAATAGGWSAAPVMALLILATSGALVLAVALRRGRD